MIDYRRLIIELVGKEPIVNKKRRPDTCSWSSYGKAGMKEDFNDSQNELVFEVALSELNNVIERCIRLDQVLVPNPRDNTIVNKYWVKETKKGWDEVWETGFKETVRNFLCLNDLDNTALITARGHFDRRGRQLAKYSLQNKTLEITDNVYLVGGNRERYLNHPLVIPTDCVGYSSQYADADKDVKTHNPFDFNSK